MKQKNIGINAVLNVIRQSLSVFFPLISYPYVVRILGAKGIGKVNYGNSIISYFSLLATLGVTTYAVREGARRKKDKCEFEKFVREVFTINIVTTLLSYFLLIIMLLSVKNFHEYKKLLLIQSLSIILTTLGTEWIITIFEDFFIITVRSIMTYMLSFLLLFLLVRTPSDYYNYAFVSVITNVIVCILNWIYCRRYVHLKLTNHPNIKVHLKPMLILFANTVAVSIYVSLDTTMIGWMKGDYAVGQYTVAVKIYNIVKSILAAIYVVVLPRLSAFFCEGKIQDYKAMCTKLWGYLSLLLVPSGISIIGLAPEIIQFMGGLQCSESVLVLQILGISLIFAVFGGLVTACMNVTLNREKNTLIATTISALINFILNLFLIPKYAQYGAAVTTVLSEMFVFLFCFFKIPKKELYLEARTICKSLFHAILGSLFIFAIILVIKSIIINYVFRILISFVFSIVGYGILLYVLKDNYFMEIFNGAKKRYSVFKGEK